MPNNIKTVPNQKVVTIKKETCSKTNPYAMVNLYAMKKAMNSLTNAEFEIWMYFAKNQNNYEFALSPEDAESWHIARTTLKRTIHRFIELKYLTQDRPDSNRFTFHEIPISTSTDYKEYIYKNFEEKKDSSLAPWDLPAAPKEHDYSSDNQKF